MQLLVQQLAPEPSDGDFGGIETMESDSYMLSAFHSLTGVQFFVTAEPKSERLDEFLRSVYTLYATYCQMNPFYKLDTPIRVDLWDLHLAELVAKYERLTS